MQKALVELEDEGLVYTERTNGKFVTDNKELIEKIKKELAETRRVLYVAITRAEKELYLVGNLNTPSSTNFYSLLKPILEKYVDGTTQIAKPDAPFSYEEIRLFDSVDFRSSVAFGTGYDFEHQW